MYKVCLSLHENLFSSILVVVSLMTSVVTLGVTLIKLYDIVLRLFSLCLRVQCDVIIS